MKLPRYSDKPFELKPEIVAVGVDDKSVKGQEVTVRLFRRVWHSQLRETHFATGDARYVTEQEDVKLSEQVVTTDTQPVSPTFGLKEAGVYVVELIARDKLGRVQTLSADLYVGGQTPMAWKKPRQGVFELATDKPKYRPGDTARIIIQSPFQQGRALVVVEEPGGNTYTWREVSGGKAVHELPIKGNHVPNIAVHVVLMRGRLGEGKTEDARYRPQTLGASIDIEVEPVRNQVMVDLKHPDMARPGTKIPVELTLKDEKGAPLAGEVTLWLVDEAVLSLAPEGPAGSAERVHHPERPGHHAARHAQQPGRQAVRAGGAGRRRRRGGGQRDERQAHRPEELPDRALLSGDGAGPRVRPAHRGGAALG